MSQNQDVEVRAASAEEFWQYVRWLEKTASWMEGRDIEQWTADSIAAQKTLLEKAWRRGELVITLEDGIPIAGALVSRSPSIEVEQLWSDVPTPDSRTQAYMQKMVIDPDRRGAGLGASVLDALEDYARALNCSGVRLDCVARNQFLPRFYQDAGYFPRGERELLGTAVIRMDKDLVAASELTAMLPGWREDFVGTLLFVVQDGKVLLIRKKRGHGAGKINAPGGKPEGTETPLECALRETLEEVGIEVADPKLPGEMKFVDTEDPQWRGYVFVAEAFQGEPRETEEAIPRWFALDEIPYAEMWEDDQLWLPHVLDGAMVDGDFLFTRGRLRAHRLTTTAIACS
ncbi:MAG: GNAT family N-acetyltransferase [Gammaproteobacteria bacterium]|nr:GNAT family N-acetyltransferase [Gammaproteobacteria bacterium]